MSIIDDLYFKDLAEVAPDSLCKNKGCTYNPSDESYSLALWNLQHTLNPKAKTISSSGLSGYVNHEYYDLFVIYYLLKVRPEIITGEWISEKDLAGGPTFFRGPHLIPTQLVSDTFINDIERFEGRCRKLGGTPVEMGDSAFTFQISPEIPVTVLYWVGDEDFPAEAKILYDRSIEDILTLDIIYALAVEICHRLSHA